jgi:hypothetical protein
MTNMQRLVLVLAFIFAVLLGILLATTVFSGPTGSPSPTSSPTASLGPSVAPASSPPSEAPSASSAAASPSPSATPKPTPTPKPIPAATVKFVQLKLDAGTDTGGKTRSISFTAQTGTVSVKLATESGGNTKMCLFRDGAQVACRTAVSGSLTDKLTKATANYRVSLRGSADATPVVTATIKFAAAKPKVTIVNARFDGTDSPATNGLQVVATPRTKGAYRVTANWGGHPFQYEVDLIEQGGPGIKTVKPSQGATSVSQSFTVTPPNAWMIVLKNTESGFGTTLMTATYTWP